MSRKVINTLFIIGSCLYIPGIAMIIWGYVTLFHNISQGAYYYGSMNTDPLNGIGAFLGLLWGGILMVVIGSITLLVARIGALMELGKAQDWVWFILMIIFGWVVLLLYLTIGPKSEPLPRSAGYPYPVPGYPPQAPGMPPVQPWAGYPYPVPGMPPAQPWSGYAPQAPGMPPTEHPSVEHPNMPEKPDDQ